MKVKFLLPKGFCKVGSIHDFPDEAAEKLIKRGYAEPISKEKPKKVAPKHKDESKPKFFRGDK